ncbi:KpsF/GutQ [Sinorhizobium fredii USDA 205]|uniref:KpsF/GutQ family sugar-phosphate isomerase n=1 Tax=Rhizobium fredii TaxID=380 RepID=A0A844ALF3_RHIFR|nr:KpsF/GutQ family sugar-phosphate isomerase [Sinorhizobium fredii]ASY71962.1 Arabinose 5-phosphate isomerase [Sinorhizobium fredii CCBAU 83666]KSV81157.1 KpsF/GutQ [Sinorhizobium fredii USDA 205]MQX12388.1 KpsF/GutQ family sugar-phosphate isomerase [Sinorhizobium fredii]GEC34758.1 sugar isomerase [Sinorhizobium fredii]GLS08086.1 sugar isomerase [Sinorhizobium fredii]
MAVKSVRPVDLTSSTFDSIRLTLATATNGIKALADYAATDEAFAQSLVDAVELIGEGRGRVVVSGVGKSGHIGRKIAATMASTGTSAYFVHPTEASHGDLGMITSEDVLILLSWSGETAELANMLTYAKRFKVPIVSISSNRASILARNSNVALVLPKVPEACPHGLAPTTSAMLQLVVGDALAIALLERRGFSAEDFKTFHPGGKLGAQLRLIDELAHVAKQVPLLAVGRPMSEAVIEMSSKGFGVVGIIDERGALVGVITDGDLRRHMAGDLLSQQVEEVMSHSPRVVKGDVLASAAMEFMQEHKVTVLFLVNEARVPVGIVHIHDLLRAGVA